MPLSSHRASRRLDIWPGFVDALASLLLVLIFVLLVFVLAQVFLADALSGRETALRSLQGQLSSLADVLALERREKGEIAARLEALQGELAASIAAREAAEAEAGRAGSELARVAGDIAALTALRDELEKQTAALAERSERAEQGLIEERKVAESARAQIALANQQLAALREQLAQLTAALGASEKKSAEQQVQITALGQRLNVALAGRVQELARYRSEFFGRLREVLGDHPDIRIVGDRFVFPSEVLFGIGQAEVGEAGRAQILRVGETLKEIAARIPPDVDWILQVEGHTDRIPIATAPFPSNWELSQARAMSVLRLLQESGIPSRRLAAAGYAEFHPLDAGEGEAALRRNRRIELKLTQR